MSSIAQKRKRYFYMFDGGPGRQYIGQTVGLRRRERDHRNDCNKGKDKALYNAVRKHPQGWDAFPLRILMTTEPITDFQSNAVEVWFIAFHNTYYKGLNETKGGDGITGWSHSSDVCERIRVAHKDKPKSPEHCANISASLRGKKRGPMSPEHRAAIGAANKGKTRSPETRAKLSTSLTGHVISPETRAKIGAANKGKTRSPETRAKLSAASKGKPKSPEHRAKLSEAGKGRTHSPETRAKMSYAKRLRDYKNNGTMKIF